MNSGSNRLIRNIVTPLAAMALLGAALTLSGGTASATTTCSVPSAAYPTIQSAVNDPTCDTIDVAPGAYAESVTINRTLTLNGAQAGNEVSGRSFGGPGESTVSGAAGSNAVITVEAPNVTVDGFSITKSLTSGAATGIDVKRVYPLGAAGDGANVSNNIIDGITTTDPSGNGAAQGVYLENGPDNVTVVGNEITNVQSPRSAKGILIGSSGDADSSNSVTVQGNSISNIKSATRGAYGVSIGTKSSLVDTGFQIDNNTIDSLNGGGWVHGVGVEANVSGLTVDGNSITNLVTPGADNKAVWFESEDSSYATSHVNNNNLAVGNAAYGIAVDSSLTGGPVDGTCNWWGASNGPGPVGSGSGSLVSANVSYSPWLTSAAPSGCNGAQAISKDQCKDGGWQSHFRADGSGFKNQGDCIQYVNTGK